MCSHVIYNVFYRMHISYIGGTCNIFDVTCSFMSCVVLCNRMIHICRTYRFDYCSTPGCAQHLFTSPTDTECPHCHLARFTRDQRENDPADTFDRRMKEDSSFFMFDVKDILKLLADGLWTHHGVVGKHICMPWVNHTCISCEFALTGNVFLRMVCEHIMGLWTTHMDALG